MPMSRFKLLPFAILCSGLLNAHALNPIHDATVQFVPAFLDDTERDALMTGESYTQRSTEKLRAPITYLHAFNSDFQMGVGLQTRWYKEPNNFREVLLGARYRLSQAWAFQADALGGVANYAGDGLALTGMYLSEPYASLHILGTARAGFFDALVWHPDFMVVSGSVTPEVILNDYFRFDLEVFTAMQTPGLSDYFGLDLLPSLVYRYNRTLYFEAGGAFGMVGPNKSSPRFQLAQKMML